MPKTEKSSARHSRDSNASTPQNVERTAGIFAEYGDLIRTIINFNLSDQRNAEDIFQDLFLALLHNPVPEGTENIKAFLYRVITNDIIDDARRTRSYRARVYRYAERRKYSVVCDDPENLVIQAEEQQEMLRLIESQLPPREAQAVIERFACDNSVENAANNMGVNKRTLSRYLCTGLKRIRNMLNQSDGDAR